MVFFRNPQLRYTKDMKDNTFAIAIENPGNDVDPGQLRSVDPSIAANPHSSVPDLTAAFRLNKAWGHVQVAGIARKLGYETVANPPDNTPKGDKTGAGADISLILNTKDKKNKLMLGGVFEAGIAAKNDGGTDLAADGTWRLRSGRSAPGLHRLHRPHVEPKFSSSAAGAARRSTTPRCRTAAHSVGGLHVHQSVSTKNVFFGIEPVWRAPGQRWSEGRRPAHSDFRSLQLRASTRSRPRAPSRTQSRRNAPQQGDV
jgi:hypothetical protein